MKWVKSSEQIKNYLKTMYPEDTEEMIEKRMNEKKIKNLFYNPKVDGELDLDEYATYMDTGKFHRWGYEVELPSSFVPNPSFDPNTPYSIHVSPHNFEIYASGWIDFWDTEVRQNSTDHALVFKLRNCDGKWYMDAYIRQLKPFNKSNVYLNVANPPTSTDPPPPPPGRGW
jgi:hypothetical protein